VFKPDLSSYEDLKRYFNVKGEKISADQKCEIYNLNLAIKTNGDIYLHMRCLPYVLGNVNEMSLDEIYESDKAQVFFNELSSADYCFPVCTRCCGSIKEG
jgi:MoaA/NifB/PqqE/SkfB family radical SAM enzyme